MALATMAFLSAGHTPRSGAHHEVVLRAVEHLVNEARSDGLLASANHQRAMYEQGLTLLVLAECLGEMPDLAREDRLRRVIDAAVGLIVRCQGPEGGWTYRAEPASHDLSLSVTQLMALRACRDAGIPIPEDTITRAVDYVRSCFDAEAGGFAYQPGEPARFSMTAAGVVSLQVVGARAADDAMIERGLALLLREKARFSPPLHHYYYGVYYAAQAAYQAGGAFFRGFFPLVESQLLEAQREDGRWEGQEEGTIMATGMAVIVLCAPRRLLPIYIQEQEEAR
jgi:hypothetical protein